MMHVMTWKSCKREICFVGPVNMHVLAVVWASIFTASTDKGVVPAWRANGSMLLLSLSHRYTSPLWWSIMYLSEPKYGMKWLDLNY